MKLFHYYHTHKGMWAKDSKYFTDGIVEEEGSNDSQSKESSKGPHTDSNTANVTSMKPSPKLLVQ